MRCFLLCILYLKVNVKNKLNYSNENQLTDYDIKETGIPTYELFPLLNGEFLNTVCEKRIRLRLKETG